MGDNVEKLAGFVLFLIRLWAWIVILFCFVGTVAFIAFVVVTLVDLESNPPQPESPEIREPQVWPDEEPVEVLDVSFNVEPAEKPGLIIPPDGPLPPPPPPPQAAPKRKREDIARAWEWYTDLMNKKTNRIRENE